MNTDSPQSGKFDSAEVVRELQPPKRRNIGPDEIAWIRQQRDTPTAVRGSLLANVLDSFTDKTARNECRRLFEQSKNDETKFAFRLEHKIEGYAKKNGVYQSLEQILIAEAKDNELTRSLLVPPTAQYLKRLDDGFNFSLETKNRFEKYAIENPQFEGIDNWQREAYSLTKSLEKLRNGGREDRVQSVITNLINLDAEVRGAENATTSFELDGKLPQPDIRQILM